jgi:hypothetical protein
VEQQGLFNESTRNPIVESLRRTILTIPHSKNIHPICATGSSQNDQVILRDEAGQLRINAELSAWQDIAGILYLPSGGTNFSMQAVTWLYKVRK